ncbi:anti-sigma factor [Bacillus ndiopicus]|uniref:anti-sigma factor n=1 Tax=Bacillus ndiopicus TaxID=1347368 RepID=UPI0005A7028A|nr:anti-sigma factor [Bacillus ndiopicus]
MSNWDVAKTEKILKRSKRILALKILRILLGVLLCFWLYKFTITTVVDKSGATFEDAYYINVATRMTKPNVSLDSALLQESVVNAFGQRSFSLYMYKRIGGEDELIGDVKVSKGLLKRHSSIRFEHPNRQKLNNYSFKLPPKQDGEIEDTVSKGTWERLEMLPEGTVAELKFSTTKLMTPKDLLTKLQPYDVDILWMPLFTGEFESFTPGVFGRDGKGNISLPHVFGLYGGSEHGGDDFRSSIEGTILQLDSIQISERRMLNNIEELLNKGANYYEGFLRLDYLEERYKFLQEKGFLVYGAVITGPTKELLRLRDEEDFIHVKVGDVALWNWRME